ncbi:hypothetical protein [Nocardioides sp.]|uniref:hypothetical protein n=1 Tax=Nocardioides sp. TaxID=35761 RepID=UPI00260D4E18|nr:hypothetical protein [Nocardioides sp.]
MPTPPAVAFLSLSRARAPHLHREINAWHQLDHRPENLALAGVAHGERFVHSPALAAASRRAGEFADFHYANIYWFDEPAGAAVEEWAELAEQSLREGRRPDVDLVDRAYMDFFRVAGTALSPGLRIGGRALHYRPVTGVVLLVTALPHDLTRSELQARHAWEIDELLPALAGVPGIAAAWSLESDPGLAPSEWARREAAQGTSERETIRVVYLACEIDPPATALERLEAGAVPGWLNPPAGDRASVRFAGALETITPWQWSWFDDEHPTSPDPAAPAGGER